jgi:hypothetical protein
MYCSEEEDGSHGSETKSTVCCAESRSSASLAASLVLGLGSLGAGVLELATAEEFALDELLVLEILVEAAGGGDVLRGLKVECTLDIIKLRGFDAGGC